MTNVAIIKQEQYEISEVKAKIEEIFNTCNLPDVKGKKVLIKPNILSDAKMEKCITTHPVIVQAVIQILKERDAKEILVGDSPGLHTPNFKPISCGIYAVLQEENVSWEDFSKDPIHIKTRARKSLTIAKVINEVDLIINLPKFKTHQLMTTTGGVKNFFGLMPGLNKSPLHVTAPEPATFARVICSIEEALPCPTFTIMDAIIGMEGAGPANGNPKQVGLLIGSQDPYGTDYSQSIIMGYKTDDIPILYEGVRRRRTKLEFNFTHLNPNDLIIKDFKRVEIKKRNVITALLLPFLTKPVATFRAKFRPYPHFNQDCILCERCVHICPAKVLQKEGDKIVINHKKCVRCYCCHEVCPKNAIDLKN